MKKRLFSIARTLGRVCRQSAPVRVVLAILILLSLPALAQSRDTNYELFGGGSYARALDSSSGNAYGWEVSITQYPYSARPWIGGTIEGSGLFQHQGGQAGSATAHESLYTCMGGLSFAFPPVRRAKPFAHAVAGAVVLRTDAFELGAATYANPLAPSSETVLGSAVGGGVDVPVRYRLTVRGVADWLTFKPDSSDRTNDLRASVGLVLKF